MSRLMCRRLAVTAVCWLAVLVQWQAAHGLVADGVIGPLTWAAMAGA